MTKSTFAKTKAQIKSYQYYLFWGACTFAVMAGQIFVGAGYQSMSNSVKDLTEIIEVKMEWEQLNRELDRRRYGNGVVPLTKRVIDLNKDSGRPSP